MSSLATFLNERRPSWQRLAGLVEQVENSGLRSLDEPQAVEFGRLYRRAASDMNQAQTFVTGDATVQYLNDLVARCYLVIYAKTKADPSWRTYAVPCGHDVMIDLPERLTQILEEAA